MAFRCFWLCRTAARPAGGLRVPWGMIWGIVSIEKSKSTSTTECIPPGSNMHAFHYQQRQDQEIIIISHLLARDSSQSAMHSPTSARSRCMFRVALKRSLVSERAQHSIYLDSPIFAMHANCSLHPASQQRPQPTGDVRIFFISLHIGPCGAPFAIPFAIS